MNRFALLAGIASGAAAWLILRQQNNQSLVPAFITRRRVPVPEAAAKLQLAWADHHTTV